MARRRDHLRYPTRLAAALREYAMTLRVEKDGKLVPALTYEQAKRMTEKEIEDLFHWDHIAPHSIGGVCQHHNLQPLLKAQHAVKTATRDIPAIAKTKRLEQAQEDFRRKVLAKTGQITEKEETKQKAKIKSRGFQQWRNFKGEIVKRKG
jgi:hypothetical protein